ncbi:hypothetical protein ACWEWX_39935, partial [Streptomyces asiaticus]
MPRPVLEGAPGLGVGAVEVRPEQNAEHRPPPRRRFPALMLGMSLAALDSTIISTAVPQIVGD